MMNLTRLHCVGLAAQLGCDPWTTQTRNVRGTLRATLQDVDGEHLVPVEEVSLVVDDAEIPVRHAYAAE